MEKYDYISAMVSDIKDYINDNRDYFEYEDREELEEQLIDELWCYDGVTGNASGSYYCNVYKAEEAVCHNFDLLADACAEFGDDISILRKGAETWDVTIRCYLLSQAISIALTDMADELFLSRNTENN